MNVPALRCFTFLLVSLLAAGCGEDTGSAVFTTWGEEIIEEGLPASEFEDGWSVRFDRFLVVVGGVRVGRRGAIAAEMSGSKLFDHVKPGVKPVVTFDPLEAVAHEEVSFTIAPLTDDTELEGATEADRELMRGAGASVHVEGVATKAGGTKSFRWTFATATRYASCRGEKDGREIEGAIVTSGGADEAELTIHGDHFFYDDLAGGTAALRFDAIAAADADDDGEVTLAELAEVKLFEIPDGSYGTGSAGGVDDLRAFVTALTRTLGHFRGEGECVSTDL